MACCGVGGVVVDDDERVICGEGGYWRSAIQPRREYQTYDHNIRHTYI